LLMEQAEDGPKAVMVSFEKRRLTPTLELCSCKSHFIVPPLKKNQSGMERTSQTP
jgi:hypothetical protein